MITMSEPAFEDHPVPGRGEPEPDTTVPDGVPDQVDDPDTEPLGPDQADNPEVSEEPDPDQPDQYADDELHPIEGE